MINILEERKNQMQARVDALRQKYDELHRQLVAIQDQMTSSQGALDMLGILTNDVKTISTTEEPVKAARTKPLASNTPNSK